MLIAAISLLASFFAAYLTLFVQNFIARIQLEKRIKTRLERTFVLSQRGLTGNILYLADILGGNISKRKYKFLEQIAGRISGIISILGDPYDRISADTYIGIQFISAFAGILTAVILLEIINPFLLTAIGIGVFFLPYLFLAEKLKIKHKTLFKELPGTLDLLALMMEAGIEFSPALERLISIERGVIIDELSSAQKEIRLGRPREEVFQRMSARLKSPHLSGFVNILTTSLRTGGNLAPALKELSTLLKLERVQLAEKAANEAPLKMMFPLIVFIFPTIFIILFGPILLTFLGNGIG